MPFRLTRLEVLLLAAIALSWIAQGVLLPKPAPAPAGTEIRRTMETQRPALEKRLREDPSLRRRFQLGLLGLMFLVLGSLLEWGRLFLRWISGSAPEPPLGSPAPPAWGFRGIFRILLGIVLLIQCSVLFQFFIFRLFHPAWLDRRVAALADTLWVDLAVMFAAARLLSRGPGSVWNRERISGSLGTAFRAYLFSAPLLILLLLAVTMVLKLFRVEPPPQAIFTLYLSEERIAVVRVLLLLAVAAGPVAEELFFRGLLYGWLRSRVGIARGIWISALLFAALHMDPVAFLPILGLGLLFGWVYERTGSLAAPIAIHVFHNGIMLYMASLIKALAVQG